MPRKPSYDDLKAERDRLDTRAFALSLAQTRMADATLRHTDSDRGQYVWKAYGLTRCEGGYLVATWQSSRDRYPSVYYTERLDTAAQQCRERYASFAECGMPKAVDAFLVERQRLIDAAA